ncbi:MAG: Ig-like domain-containing protein, partial [Lachnospiraceae bacterium]|nr:Ig-like domain-containing protein [Lachnospiraceae bacterium]
AENRSYEQGNKKVKVTDVTFNGVASGDTVVYSATGEMEDDSAGNSKKFTATVTINSRNYVLGSNTGSGTVKIAKAEYPYGILGITKAVVTSDHQVDSVEVELDTILDGIASAGGTDADITSAEVLDNNKAVVSSVSHSGTKVTFSYNQSEHDKESNIKVLIDSDNYEQIEIRIFVITYTNVTGVSFNGYSGESEGKWVLSYNGDPELNKITAKAVNVAQEDGSCFTWSCDNTEVAEIVGTGKTVIMNVKKPGTALITARYKKDGWTGLSSIPLLVKKGDPNPAFKELSYSYVYGDTPLELKKEDISSNPGNGDVTFSYKPKDAEDSSYVSVPPTEAGEYTARAVIAETAFYKSAECTVDYIVEKRPVDLKSAVPERRSYEPGNKGVAVYEGGFTDKNGREVQNFYPGIDYTISGNMIDEKAGKDKAVTVKAVCLNPNYAFNTDTVTCTTDIYKAVGEAHGQQEVVTFRFLKDRERKNMRLDLSGAAERESGARLTSAHLRMDRHGVIENVGVGTDFEFTVSGNCILFDMAASEPYSDTNNMADIGAVFETDNYIDYEETVLIEIVDSKDETEVKIGGGERERTLSYGDEGFTLKASAPATKEAGYYSWYSSNSYVAAVDINTGEVTVNNAGTAVITALFESDSYMGSAQLKLTVEAVDAEITPPEAVKGLVYNGSMQELIKPGTVVGGKMYYALSSAAGTVPDIESFSEALPTAKDPGTYYVYYLVNADNNHKDVDIPEPISVTVIDLLRVPVLNPDDVFASSNDNIAPVCTEGNIKKLGLDFSKVRGSGVDPMGLKMTVIAGSKLTTAGTLSDKSKVTVTDGIRVKYKKSSKTATVICKANGTATFNMEDGNVYRVEFTVEKPKAVKSEKKMGVGGAKVTKTALDLFKTTIDGGEMSVLKEKKAGQAEASGSSVTIDPAEKDSIKLQYKFLNKKYKTAIKIK